jgi:membrane protease YdiL (CAAX protease family)
MIPPARQVDPRANRSLVTQIVVIAAVVVAVVVGIVLVNCYVDLGRWADLGVQITIGVGGLAYLLTQPHIRAWLAAVSVEQWRAIDRETLAAPLANPHLRVLIVMLVTAGSLTVQEYIGGADRYEQWFPYDPFADDQYWELKGFVWWSGWRVLGYVVIPAVAIALMPGERVRDYHISPRGFFKHLWIYAVMFVAFSPIVVVASLSDSFRDTYPFYRLANRSRFDLWAWEALYVVQFIALEFFFRGFMLQALRRAIGANAIFVMIVPYCMIHYGKPMAETFGAIGAGLVLGTLAMRTRSIWGGVLIHCGVALSMDVLALRGCPPTDSGQPCHP